MLAPRAPSTTELSGIHVANKTKLPSLLASLCILGVLSFTRSANFVHCFISGRKAHQSPTEQECCVSLQNRSAVSPYRTGVLCLPTEQERCVSLQNRSAVSPYRTGALCLPTEQECCVSLQNRSAVSPYRTGVLCLPTEQLGVLFLPLSRKTTSRPIPFFLFFGLR